MLFYVQNISARFLFWSALCIFTLGYAAAHAADMSTKDSTWRPAATSPALFLPQGLYVNAGAGYSFTAAETERLTLSATGATYELCGGYDGRLGTSKFIAGPRVCTRWANLGGEPVTARGWGLEAGGRAGYVFNSSDLVYAVAAYRRDTLGIGTGAQAYQTGLYAGGGVEFDLTNRVTFAVEGGKVWFQDWNAGGTNVGDSRLEAKIKVGLRLN